jgi:hypothetical protein
MEYQAIIARGSPDLDELAILVLNDNLFVAALGNSNCVSDGFVLGSEYAARESFSSDPFSVGGKDPGIV